MTSFIAPIEQVSRESSMDGQQKPDIEIKDDNHIGTKLRQGRC